VSLETAKDKRLLSKEEPGISLGIAFNESLFMLKFNEEYVKDL